MELQDQEAANLANHGRRKTTIPIHLKSNSSAKPSRAKTRNRGSRSTKKQTGSYDSKLLPMDCGLDDDIENINIPSTKPAANEPLHKNKRLNWDHPVKQLGAKIVGDYLFCCQLCDLPILVYGRLNPCRHTFCNDCAKKDVKNCPRCKSQINVIEQSAIGTVFICTYGAPKHGHDGCKRSYLSTRDLQAHIEFRHKGQGATSSSVSKQLSPVTAPPITLELQSQASVRETSRSMSVASVGMIPSTSKASSLEMKVHQTQIPNQQVTMANKSPVSAQIIQQVPTIPAQNTGVGNTLMMGQQENQSHYVQSTVPLGSHQPLLQKQNSGTQPAPIQQQTMHSNIQAMPSMTRPPPITMTQQGSQAGIPFQGMPTQQPQQLLPQPTPPSQVARIALANQQAFSRPPIMVPPPQLRPGVMGQGHLGASIQTTGQVTGETQHMNTTAPPIESYHSAIPPSQGMGAIMDNLITIKEDRNNGNFSQQSADRAGYQQQQYQVNQTCGYIRPTGMTVQQQPAVQGVQQAPPPSQQRMMYSNNQLNQMPYGRGMNTGEQSPQMLHGNQSRPPLQQSSSGHYQGGPQGGPQGHRPGYNQPGPNQGMWNRAPRGGPIHGRGGPMRHPRPRGGRNFYN